MTSSREFLAIIPARGGSKGVPKKNIKELGGKPLIAWTIEAAKQSKYLNRVILTSEDDEIIEIAKKFECDVPFKRPEALAEDKTPGISPVLHAVEMLPGYKNIVLLQPTSPLRTTEDIDRCIEKFLDASSKSCVSVVESDKPPYWMYSLKEDGEMDQFIKGDFNKPRQELPKAYVLNGAVYVANTKWLIRNKKFMGDNTIGYVMSELNSVDIDTPLDFDLANFIIKRKSEGGIR